MKNSISKNVELLAPAGSYDAFIASINAGADAVYMGLKNFNARVMTTNFSLDEYIKAIDYAHKRDVKVYLTLNTLLLDNEIEEAIESVYELYKVGLDGVILQDLGVASLIHEVMPQLSMHASTQMSICTLEQVKMLEKLGFERVVLARELSIEEIAEIAKNTKLEIEVFVHGALCVSISGQCLMSAMIGNRSANRGSCAGTCRKKYSLYSTNGKLIQKNKYLLSKKDIYGLELLQKLIDAGVYSLKIEGRNKGAEYVAGVVKNYRYAIDYGYTKSQEQEVLQLFNRSGKMDGYLTAVRYRNSISENTAKNTGLLLGKVLAKKNSYIKIKLEQDIDLHDGIECIDGPSTIVTCIRDENFNVINTKVEKGSVVWLGDIKNVAINWDIYKTSSNKLNSDMLQYVKTNLKRLEYDVLVSIKENENIYAICNNLNVSLDYIPEKSINASISDIKVKEAFSKTEETSVKFNISCNIDSGLFVPSSKLNELRRLLLEEIEGKKIIRKDIKSIDKKIQHALKLEKTEQGKNKWAKQNSLYVYRYNSSIDYIKWYNTKYNKKLDVLYITASDFKLYEQDILKYLNICKVYFVIPNVTLKNITNYINSNLENLCKKGISGILLGNIGYIHLCNRLKEKYNVELVADYSLNVMNKYSANVLRKLGIDRLTPLFENEQIDLESINDILQVELVCDMVTVMTTRYCVIASYAKNSLDSKKCEAECTKNNYYLIDELNKRYDIITDKTDCISRFVRNKKSNEKALEEKFSTRHCIL